MLTLCGIYCDECQYFEKSCSGCQASEGKPFWLQFAQIDRCRLHKCCVDEKKFESCGQCPELPCDIFFELKDPGMSEEAHRKSIDERVRCLKRGDRG